MTAVLLCASIFTVLRASLGLLVLSLAEDGALVLSLAEDGALVLSLAEGRHCEVASFASQQATPYRVKCKGSKIL
jgi:hypothetical protein